MDDYVESREGEPPIMSVFGHQLRYSWLLLLWSLSYSLNKILLYSVLTKLLQKG